MSHEIATLPAQHLVVATTNFAVDVTVTNLDPDLTVKDFVVVSNFNSTIIPLQHWVKTSRTVVTYTGPALLAGFTLTVSRSTNLDRVQHSLQLGSTISSSILDAEILRIYKLIAEKLNTILVSSQVNNVTRSTGTPSTPPAALGDEWHQIDTGGSGGSSIATLRIWIGTDTGGVNDTNGWFEVTDAPPAPGNDGIAATINVGSVTTGAPGSNVAVVNAGSVNAAVLNFTIPRGNPGSNGLAATLTIGSVVTGSSAIVTNSGTSTAAVLNFTIPKGDKGDVGPAGSVNAANGIAFTHQATPADPGSSKTILYSKADGLPYYLPTGNVERRILNETDLYTAVITEATTTRTLLLTDANKGIVTTNASAVTITIPPNSTTPIPIGSKAEVFQRGTGVLTVIGAATVVVNGVTTGSVNAAAQFSSLILWKIGTDEWLVEVDSGNQEYSELLNIPSTFTPAAHTQAISTITDLQTALDVKAPLTPAQDTITYAATVDLNMTTLNGQLRTISLTGNLTLTVSNQASQRSVILRLVSDATLRTLTFPADWKFLGTKPANIAASKVGVLSLTFFGSTDADCVAAWGVQS